MTLKTNYEYDYTNETIRFIYNKYKSYLIDTRGTIFIYISEIIIINFLISCNESNKRLFMKIGPLSFILELVHIIKIHSFVLFIILFLYVQHNNTELFILVNYKSSTA